MRIAVFVSGNGSNCESLIRHFQDSQLARVVLVLSNRKDAYALVRAERLGVKTVVMERQSFNNPEELLPLLKAEEIDFIVLAGFLLMIPSWLIARYDRRIINLHPALLPKFGGKGMYGRHVHEAVKAAGEKETGMTVHYVSDVCDGGEIIAQYSTPIAPEDSAEDIAVKEHALEMRHFAGVVEKVVAASRR